MNNTAEKGSEAAEYTANHLQVEVNKLKTENYELRNSISTFLDEVDAGGTPSYDSLRALLKQYK